MIAAFQVFRRALGDAWDSIVLLAILNLLWVVLSFTIVLLPGAAAALFEATHSLARGDAPGVRDFLGGVRRHFVRGWAWALVNLVAWSILLANIVFYRTRPEAWAAPLLVFFLFLAALWLIAQFYVWPFVFEQTEMSLRRAFRNALLMAAAAPIFSLVLGLLGALVVAMSIVLVVPLLVITGSFLSLLASHAVIDRLRRFHLVQAPAGDGE